MSYKCASVIIEPPYVNLSIIYLIDDGKGTSGTKKKNERRLQRVPIMA